ncbi:MAG: hypothetical protein JXQ75_06670 [Phycisphaerae bacterium]|nr:hypothetical protein [Phycisphaerae bacterium]
MHWRRRAVELCAGIVVPAFVLFTPAQAEGELALGPQEFVQAGGVNIDVPGYSVPSFVYWNGDDLKDLVVGQGDGTTLVRVRVYLNEGTTSEPAFSTYFYAQSNGSDLTVTGSG